MMSLRLHRQERTLCLQHGAGASFHLPLGQGGCHRIVVAGAAQAQAVVQQFEAQPEVAVLGADGGLLSGLSVAANLSLALRFSAEHDADMLRDLDHDLQLALRLLGLPADRLARIGRELPAGLSRLECWMVGLVRNLLRPPELLVLDRSFSGLSRQQVHSVLAMLGVYAMFHPFRPTLFVDVQGHELPEIPFCQQTMHLEMEVVACPS